MQVMELSKGKGSALAVTLSPKDAETFAQELRQVKQALLDWRAKHRANCEMVMFTVVTEPDHHPAIESLIDRVYREEDELSPLLQSVEVQVALLNTRGKPQKEYAFPKLAQTEPAKPWWRFW